MDMFQLQGRVALVTGGAGKFGAPIVEALAETGATTILTSRDPEKAKASAGPFQERGLSVLAESVDQGDESSVTALLQRVVDQHGAVDVLVNNAVLRPMRSWSDPAETFEQSMHANVTGPFLMTRAFGDHMANRGDGSIINVGSIQGHVGPDFTLYEGLGMDAPPDYFAHKGAMAQLTRYTAEKLGPHGVRVNTLSPGGLLANQDATFVERYSDRTCLRRMASEADIKGPIIFLASEASRYMTGTTLMIDGGYTAK
jgi:NAD(P)-dependent dehydrogenase (short-subunit alcohol dehydrogenase family)